MTPVLWGALSSLCFGCNDVFTRIIGRDIGPINALFGTFVTSAIGLTLWVMLEETQIAWDITATIWLIGSGMTFMAGTLLLYMAYARGPISVAAPLVNSFPVFVLIWALIIGIAPTLIQWIGMAVIMIGVLIVARTGRSAAAAEPTGTKGHPRTIAYTLIAAATIAGAIMAAREASLHYGEVHTLWLTRVIGTVALVLYIVITHTPLRVPWRWWPVLALQGALISIGFLAMFIGIAGEGAALAVVASTPAAAVTAVLASIFLREIISLAQWVGIVTVIVGVAGLAYFG